MRENNKNLFNEYSSTRAVFSVEIFIKKTELVLTEI